MARIEGAVEARSLQDKSNSACDDTSRFRLECWRRVGRQAPSLPGFDQLADISLAIIVLEHPLATLSRSYLHKHARSPQRKELEDFCNILDGINATSVPCEAWVERTISWYNRAFETAMALELDVFVWHSAWWGVDEESKRLPQLEESMGITVRPHHSWFPSDVAFLTSIMTESEVVTLKDAYQRTASPRVRQHLDGYLR